jgi:hypothetical protein
MKMRNEKGKEHGNKRRRICARRKVDRDEANHYIPNRNDSELKAEPTKGSIIRRLKEEGLKISPQRLAVIDVLMEKRELHPGPTLVYQEARKKRGGLSLSTVYAALDA